MRLLLALILGTTAPAAFAQNELSTGPLAADPMTCAQYEAMDDGGRVAALMGIEPFGDELGAEDVGASPAWADEVAKHCAGHPERSLTEAANAANTAITGN